MMLPVPGSYFRLVPRCPPFINVPRNLKENSYFGMRKQILKLIGECEGAGLSCVRSFTVMDSGFPRHLFLLNFWFHSSAFMAICTSHSTIGNYTKIKHE